MDISILLALQQLRESLPSFIETFFVLLSAIGDGPPLVALVLIVYWCVDKRAGQFSFIAFGAGNFVNQLLKNIMCVYRPWIRDSAVVPSEKAIEGAGGYSFPSGHTTGTTTSLGSFAWVARGKHLWVVIVCVVVIVLMMFSRLFLGVHTPQDVIAGLLIGIAAIALTQLFLNWMDRWDAMMPGHNKDLIVAAIVIVVSIASVAFVMLKPYPMDYVNGELLVDPVTMQKGSFEAAGIMIGITVYYLFRRRKGKEKEKVKEAPVTKADAPVIEVPAAEDKAAQPGIPVAEESIEPGEPPVPEEIFDSPAQTMQNH